MTRTEVSYAVMSDGSRQLVRSYAPPERSWGAMLLVHGIGEHSGRYDQVANSLAESGLWVRSFDLRGHGASDGRRVYVRRFEQFVDDVEHHAQLFRQEVSGSEREQGPFFLFGHSMGGVIALHYSLAGRKPRPELLVLSAPAIAAETPAWQRLLAPVLSRSLPVLPVAAPVHLHQLSTDPAVGEAYDRDPLVVRTVTARLGHELFRAMEQAREMLPRLAIPTLVIHGGDDTLVPTRSSEVAGALPGVRRIVYEGFRHELHHEPGSGRVLADVVDFLRSGLRIRNQESNEAAG